MRETLDEHYGYLSDRVKVGKYRAAIGKIIRPEHTVLDLGCGTGLLGLLALRAGARKVFFVDEAAVIDVARRAVSEAGFAGRADYFQANSFELALPERIDVVLCDHVGYFGFDYGILALLTDARERFLKPDGIVVPAAIDLEIAPVKSADCRRFVGQWRDGSVPDGYEWLSETAANSKHAAALKAEDLLASPATIASLELGAKTPDYQSWKAAFQSTWDATLDGIGGWFDCRLADDIRMTNSPLATERLDRPQAFLPLAAPVSVHAGDTIEVTVMARHADNVIGWNVELPRSGKRFSQTTFNGLLLDREALTRAKPDRVAALNDRGHARQIVLSCCDGRRTVAEVQALVERDYPALFPSRQAAVAFITQVLTWDTSA